MRPFSLRIFVPSGDPSGVLVATRDDGIGKAVMFPRPLLGEAKGRKEWQLPGVYLLLGEGKLYIGEGDPAGKRLEDHAAKKAFWDRALFFTADTRLNKAHIQHLESRLIKLASASKVFSLDNGNAPQPPVLGEEEYAFAENVLADLLLMLPLLGVKQFEQDSASTLGDEITAEADSGEVSAGKRAALYAKLPHGMAFRLADKEAVASLKVADAGVMVEKGSTVIREPKSHFEVHAPGYAQTRKQLIDSGVIAEHDGKLTFMQDQFFSSASAAAAIIRGQNSNADHWTSADGKNLGDMLRALRKKSET